MRLLITVLMSLCLAISGCASKSEIINSDNALVQGEELYCVAENNETAENIAALYCITLVSYEWGIATFHSEEDPETVIERGRINGWPLLSLNTEKQLIG